MARTPTAAEIMSEKKGKIFKWVTIIGVTLVVLGVVFMRLWCFTV